MNQHSTYVFVEKNKLNMSVFVMLKYDIMQSLVQTLFLVHKYSCFL